MGPCELNPEPNNTEICYGELGCFTNDFPFNNTLNRLPRHIVVTFRLFTETCATPYILHSGNTEFISTCNFDPLLPLKFVVHGFRQSGEDEWVRDMAAALLEKEQMSVITVDWGSGSGLPYLQAAANTRVVGAEISRLIESLRVQADVSPGKIHIIGYSLGAHIAGYAGQRINGIGRITGFGLMKDTGHMDFYPNGGGRQPGCSGGILLGRSRVSCSHSRAIYLFMESINTTCPFYGHLCGSIDNFDSNKRNCLACSQESCLQMGYNADKSLALGKFYLRTRAEWPYCGYTHYVEVAFGSMDPINGEITIEMIGQDQTSDSVAIRRTMDTGSGLSKGTRKKFTCSSCQKAFNSNARLKFHQKNIHSELIKNTTCCQCEMRFCSVQSLRRHVNLKHLGVKDHTCEICKKNFANKTDMMSHKRQAHSLMKMKCERCGHEFGYKSSHKRHMLSCGKQTRDISCETCGKSFRSKNSLYQHRRDKHSSEVFICDICAKCFYRKHDLKRHTQTVHRSDQ